MKSDEKRQYPRFPSNLETIYFSQDQHAERMYYPGVIVDRSKGGVGMKVNFPHNPPEELWLEGMDGFRNPVRAEVKWFSGNAFSEPEQFRVGLSFLPVN